MKHLEETINQYYLQSEKNLEGNKWLNFLIMRFYLLFTLQR